MDQYHPPDRISRMELRRNYLDQGVRRSLSLDAHGHIPQGHHHDNHSLGGESFDDDEDDQRCHSPLPCNEGCRDLFSKLMSPMISSVAIDRSVPLGREEPPRQTGLPQEEPKEEARPSKRISQPDSKQAVYAARKSVRELYGQPSWWGDGGSDEDEDGEKAKEKRPLSQACSVEASRKTSPNGQASITPSGLVNNSEHENDLKETPAIADQGTKTKSGEAFTIDLHSVALDNEPKIEKKVSDSQDNIIKPAEAFIIDLDATVEENNQRAADTGIKDDGNLKTTPRRQAEAFTIDLKGEGPGSCASGGVCVPERLRRALQERQQLQRKHSIPTDKSTTAPTNKKAPPKRTGDPPRLPTKSSQTVVPKLPARPKTGVSRSPAASSIASPKNLPRGISGTTHVTPKVTKTSVVTATATTQKKEFSIPKTPRAPNPLTQRNRIPLRQAPSKVPATTTTNGTRKPTTGRIDVSRATPSLSASPPAMKASRLPNIPRTPVAAIVQSNRALLKRGSGPLPEESGVKRPTGSPLTRRVPPSVKTASGVGRHATPTRTVTSENKRLALVAQNTTRPTKAPAVPNAPGVVATSRPRPNRPLFNSIKKPITTTIKTTNSITGIIGLPTKPMFSGNSVCDPLIQEIWSYKEAKDYVLEKMFQGIAATYNAIASSKSTTQSVFEEFKAAASQSAATTAAIKAAAGMTISTTKPGSPTICTPEERKELELFERVEAEIDKFGDGDEEALVKVLSPLVEDFGKTWTRGKNVSKSVEISHTPVEKLPVIDNTSNPNLTTQVMSAAASTVTLENPLTHPDDHKADPDSLQNAQSFQSIAETYVLDANDTLAAEGIPPVVIYDSTENFLMKARGETSIMETSNTCTVPYQETSRSATPMYEGGPDETQALEIFEKEINDEFKAEANSLSGSEDLDAKSNGSGGGLTSRHSRHQDASAVPEYLVKTPCWLEKHEGSKKLQNQVGHDKTWEIVASKTEASNKTDSHLSSSKHISSPDQPPYHSTDSRAVFSDENVVDYPVSPISQNTDASIANIYNKISPTKALPTPQGRIFVADDPSDFLNVDSTSTSSSSSSPLIDHFKQEFLQPAIQPLSAFVRPTAHVVSSSFDRNNSTGSHRTQSANAHRSWHMENSSLEENWSQLRRYASRCSVHSEYAEGRRSPAIGYSHGHHRHRYPSMRYCGQTAMKNSDAIYPPAIGQQPLMIRSTHSTASLDTALLLRDSQEALNEIAQRIRRQPTHPTVPAAPIQLPQLQNLSTYLAHRYTDSNTNKNSAGEKHSAMSPLSHLMIGEFGTQSIDRSLVGGKSVNQQPRHFFTTAHSLGQNEANQSVNNPPYSPPVSAPPISPVSIASATEPGHPFRSGRRPANSNRFAVRRHSLRNSNNQRIDSPTPDDIFPVEHKKNTTPDTHAHPPPSYTAPKVVTEVKPTPSRPSGISVTTTVAPLILQRRAEAETKPCPAVAIIPIIRGSQTPSTTTDASIGGSSSSMRTSSTEETHGNSFVGIAKPVARRFDAPAEDVIRGSAFSTVPPLSRIAIRPTELRSTDPSERNRRSMSLGPVDTPSSGGPDDEVLPLPDPSDKNYETLLAASILRLSNRLRRCSDNLAQKIGAPSSDTNSPVGPSNWNSNLKSSTSLHQELSDSLSNMRTVEQQLQYMENVLFGGRQGSVSSENSAYARSKSSTETNYLQELERINNDLKGFVPIGVSQTGEKDTTTEISHISTEATDSGVDASLVADRGNYVKSSVSMETVSAYGLRRSDEDPAFPSGDFY